MRINKTKKIQNYKRKTYKKGGTTTVEDPLKNYMDGIRTHKNVSVLTQKFADQFELTSDEDIKNACSVLYEIMKILKPEIVGEFEFPSKFISFAEYQTNKQRIVLNLRKLNDNLSISKYVSVLKYVIQLCSSYMPRHQIKFPPSPPEHGSMAPDTSSVMPLPNYRQTPKNKNSKPIGRTLPSFKSRYLMNFLKTEVKKPLDKWSNRVAYQGERAARSLSRRLMT
jgi:hypothetical protein